MVNPFLAKGMWACGDAQRRLFG